MALGMDWLSTPTISVIAILATIGILSYILMTLQKANYAYLACMGLIIGGALGNITDRIFMGIVGGYGGVLHGHVVDFIHFNLSIGDWPVFPYIFNVADIAISTSIIILLIFHKKIMPVTHDEPLQPETDDAIEESNVNIALETAEVDFEENQQVDTDSSSHIVETRENHRKE